MGTHNFKAHRKATKFTRHICPWASECISCGNNWICHSFCSKTFTVDSFYYSLVEVELTNAAQEGQEAPEEIEDKNLGDIVTWFMHLLLTSWSQEQKFWTGWSKFGSGEWACSCKPRSHTKRCWRCWQLKAWPSNTVNTAHWTFQNYPFLFAVMQSMEMGTQAGCTFSGFLHFCGFSCNIPCKNIDLFCIVYWNKSKIAGTENKTGF